VERFCSSRHMLSHEEASLRLSGDPVEKSEKFWPSSFGMSGPGRAPRRIPTDDVLVCIP
jgi:hypothetical protein